MHPTLRLVPFLLPAALAAQQSLDLAVPARVAAGCTPVGGAGTARLFGGRKWDNGLVPFVYAANVTPAMQTAMAAAMAEVALHARITFTPRATQADYVIIRDSNINSSPIGRVGGVQFLDITNWNQRFEMAHALMHVLGFWHEHQRPDRDQFVAVQTANVDPLFATDFQLVPIGTTFGLAYDFDSVMHFGATAGGIGGATTIVVLPPNQSQQGSIGQRTHLSTGDAEALRRAYGSATPPTIASVTPGSVPSYRPPQVLVIGTLFDEATRVLLDATTVPFTVQSPTQMALTLPLLPTIGTHSLRIESGAGQSQPVPFVITAVDPPVLAGPGSVARVFALPYQMFSDVGRVGVLLAAPDNVPSSAPGIVNLGIGSQFTTVFEVVRGVANASGMAQVLLQAPATVPVGTQFWLQAWFFDPANPVLPVSTSGVLPVTII